MGPEDRMAKSERPLERIPQSSPPPYSANPDNGDRIPIATAREIQAATLHRYIDGWIGWTVDGFLASWSEDCTQQALPFSSGKPPLSRAQAEQLFPHLMSVMTDFKVYFPTPALDIDIQKTGSDLTTNRLPCTTSSTTTLTAKPPSTR